MIGCTQFVFDPQGQHVGLAYTTSGKYRIAAVDLSTGAPPVLQATHLPVFPRLMAFTGDGQEIMLVGQNFSQQGQPAGWNQPDRPGAPVRSRNARCALADGCRRGTRWELWLGSLFKARGKCLLPGRAGR